MKELSFWKAHFWHPNSRTKLASESSRIQIRMWPIVASVFFADHSHVNSDHNNDGNHDNHHHDDVISFARHWLSNEQADVMLWFSCVFACCISAQSAQNSPSFGESSFIAKGCSPKWMLNFNQTLNLIIYLRPIVITLEPFCGVYTAFACVFAVAIMTIT